MSGSFGGHLPMLVIIALVVLAAAGGAIYLVRRFGVGGKPEGVARGRQSRLAMVDSASIIDGRKLVIVRRDNVEHLLLIGGATDVLIEPHISRPAVAAHPAAAPHAASAHAREAPTREPVSRVGEPEPAPRLATPPEHAARPSTPAAREIPLADSAGWPLQPDHAVRTATSEPHAAEPVSPPARATETARVSAPESAARTPEGEPVAAPTDHFAELAAALQRPGAAAPDATKSAAAHPPGSPPAAEDANLTDMAHRLEAALRRPLSPSGPTLPQPKAEPRRGVPGPGAPSATPRVTPTVEAPRVPPRLVAEPRVGGEPHPTGEPRRAPEVKVDSASDDEKPPFESLEREMASLLGRPPR